MLYWIHRLGHTVPFLRKYHADHHRFINRLKNKSKWEFNNLFLYNDTTKSTVDLWLTEVIPTLIFCFVTEQWWIAVLYYGWAALLQEYLEHNDKINVPVFTFGKWHLLHHKDPTKNFSLIFPLWDRIFKTNKEVN
jgi:sterol desaturase/sphingolipid hydroxylase (fatty acid hydroxylase superfamily)